MENIIYIGKVCWSLITIFVTGIIIIMGTAYLTVFLKGFFVALFSKERSQNAD